jgi:hypothetical protein
MFCVSDYCLAGPEKCVRFPRSVVFMFDRSGSMTGDPIRYAKAALLNGLHMLGPEDKFTVVAFDHEQLWWTGECIVVIVGLNIWWGFALFFSKLVVADHEQLCLTGMDIAVVFGIVLMCYGASAHAGARGQVHRGGLRPQAAVVDG